MERLKSVDRLNKLDDSLIHLILSFMEMGHVVRTSLISKRWKDLWTTIPYLFFDVSEKNPVQTRDYINGFLLRWRGIEIQKLSIRFGKYFDVSLSGDLDIWVGFAAERKVEKVYIILPYELREPLASNPVYFPPHCLYSCSSITKLQLVGFNLEIRENVRWSHLKVLMIKGYNISGDVISHLVSSSPHLEILHLRIFGRRHSLSIRSRSLKSLTLENFWRYSSPSDYKSLTIWAPNLESLAVDGVVFSTCLLLDVSSLTAANLRLFDTNDVAIGEALQQFLPPIQHVEALTLSLFCFKMLGVMKANNSFSVLFPNVKILKVSGGPVEPYDDVVGLNEFFPKMEKLVIDWKHCYWYPMFLANLSQKHDIGENCSYLMQLRTVEVCWYSYDTTSIIRFIKFMLEHAAVVQKIVIKHVGVLQLEALVLAAQQLLSLQRSFPAVHLILY